MGRRAYLQKWIANAQRRLAGVAATENQEPDRAEALVAGAVVHAKEGSLQEVLRRLPAGTAGSARASPARTDEALDRDEDERRAFDAFIERVQEATKKRREQAKNDAQRRATQQDADAAIQSRINAPAAPDELAAQIRRQTGLAVSPRAAARIAGPDARLSDEDLSEVHKLPGDQAPDPPPDRLQVAHPVANGSLQVRQGVVFGQKGLSRTLDDGEPPPVQNG